MKKRISVIAILPLLLLTAASLPCRAQQMPIPPVRIEWKPGSGNPITITLTGMEQDPVEVKEQWSAEDACLANVPCFVASWIQANRSGDVQHIMALRDPSERASLQKIMDQQPKSLEMNAARFKVMRKWGLLGWVDYGPFRVVLLTRENDPSSKTTYTLPLRRSGSGWAQTDALADDDGVYAIMDRVANEVLHRHEKKAQPK